MKRLVTTAILFLFLSTAWSGDLDDAYAASARKDNAVALEKFRSAAAKGDTEGMYGLGAMYEHGSGVPREPAAAEKWYRLAAERGDVGARTKLGSLYVDGVIVKRDYIEAAKWYRLAAAQADRFAQQELGALYFKGQGVAQNYVKAHMWFNLGAIKGREAAINGRNDVAKLMTTQQIADAQRMASACQARDFKGCD